MKLDSKGFGPAARANAIFEAVTNKSWQNFTICHFLRSSCRNELGVRVCVYGEKILLVVSKGAKNIPQMYLIYI